MEYSSSKKARLPGISLASPLHDGSDNNNADDNDGGEGVDVTMLSDSDNNNDNYQYRCHNVRESPLIGSVALNNDCHSSSCNSSNNATMMEESPCSASVAAAATKYTCSNDRKKPTIIEEDSREEACGGEQTAILDMAAEYMARMARDGLYDDVDRDDGRVDNHGGAADTKHSSYEDGDRCDDDDDDNNNSDVPSDKEDGDNINYDDNDYSSYYIGEGFCSSASVDDSDISETASEEDGSSIGENDDVDRHDDSIDDGLGNNINVIGNNTSCSLDLTGIETIMNLDDTVIGHPSSDIRNTNDDDYMQQQIMATTMNKSNSDVDLSGMDGIMNLDETLPLDDYNCSRRDEEDEVGNEEDCQCATNGEILQDEPSFILNTEEVDDDKDDNDDFVPSSIKQLFCQQESQFSSLLHSISNIQSTPGRIQRLEASLLGGEDDYDEDAGLDGIVVMTNNSFSFTPVTRRKKLVAEEELRDIVESASAGKSGIESESLEREVSSTTAPLPPSVDLTESLAKNEASPSKSSLDLEVDRERGIVTSLRTTTESPVIAADSSDASSKSPLLTFLSRNSPNSQSQEATPPPTMQPEVADISTCDLQESPSLLVTSNFPPSKDPNKGPKLKAEGLETYTDQMKPEESSECEENENEVHNSIRHIADTDSVVQILLPSPFVDASTNATALKNGSDVSHGIEQTLKSTNNIADSTELEKVGVSDCTAAEPTPSMREPAKAEDSIRSDEVELNESEKTSDCSDYEEKTSDTDIQNSIDSDDAREPEPLDDSIDQSTSTKAIGSVTQMDDGFQIAEPSLNGEEPTLECLRGAFLAAELKLVEESKVVDTNDVNGGSKPCSFSVINDDTFETAHFSLGDIEKAVLDHCFFDAEEKMKDVDGTDAKTCNDCDDEKIILENVAQEDDQGFLEDEKRPASGREGKLPSGEVIVSKASRAENHLDSLVRPSGDADKVDKLDESTVDAVTSPVTNNFPDDMPANGTSVFDESLVDESMFMPNSSMEVASTPVIGEENLPQSVVDTNTSMPAEEYESEDEEYDEDFFPNRDLRRSANVLKDSVAATNLAAAEKMSLYGNATAPVVGSEKVLSSRLLNVPKRKRAALASVSSTRHSRQSTSTSALKPASSSNRSMDEKSQRSKESTHAKQSSTIRQRAKKGSILMGKENIEVERTAEEHSIGALKKSSYSVGHFERLAKPRGQSIAHRPSLTEQNDSKKVASIVRLSRLAQPRRQSVAPTFSPEKKSEPKVAAGTPSFVRRSVQMSSLKPKSKSTEEMEVEAITQIKPFKAKPLNGREIPSRFKAHQNKPPRSIITPHEPVTKVRPNVSAKTPSRLYQPKPWRDSVSTFGESMQSYLNNGLRSLPPPSNNVTPKLTAPKPFALSVSHNASKLPPVSSDEIELQKKFKAKPYPFHRRLTTSFSQPKSSEELELEECRKQFKALPLPRSVSSGTRINFSKTPYHIKAEQQHQMAKERKQMTIANESQEATSFKARPVPRSTYEARKIPKPANNSSVRTSHHPPRLSLGLRAEQRKIFDEHARELRERDAAVKENVLKQQKEWEDKELKHRRVTSAEDGGMCFKALEIHIAYM